MMHGLKNIKWRKMLYNVGVRPNRKDSVLEETRNFWTLSKMQLKPWLLCTIYA